MFWAEDGFVDVDPESTQFSVSVYDAPLPKPTGFSVTCSPFRRPSFEYAPTDAKAACHYPNSARAIREAQGARLRQCGDARSPGQRGGTRHRQHLVRQGRRGAHAGAQRHLPQRRHPPARDRPAARGRHQGARALDPLEEFLEADEVFSTGNYAKVAPITRVEQKNFSPARSCRRRASSTGTMRWAGGKSASFSRLRERKGPRRSRGR